jgi:hypothetical protein
MVKTFDPCVFHVSQQDAAVAMLESLGVAFEDVEYFLDDGCLVDGVIVPIDDNTVHNISANGDVFVFRGSGLFVSSHAFWRGYPRYRLIIRLLFHPFALISHLWRSPIILSNVRTMGILLSDFCMA